MATSVHRFSVPQTTQWQKMKQEKQKEADWRLCSMDARAVVKTRCESVGSATGSDSDNSVVQHQMKQVMGDLVSVLGELRTVVGDIKTLVSQIDVVTHKIDESVCPGDELKRRASAPETQRSDDVVSVKNRPVSCHLSETVTKHDKDLSNSNIDGKHRLSAQTAEHKYNLAQQNETRHTTHADENANHHFGSSKPQRDKTVAPQRKHPRNNYVNHMINVSSIDMETTKMVKVSKSDASHLRKENSKTESPAKTLASPTDTWTSSMASDHSPCSEYSGLYEREMEDSLELEISESLDILDQCNDIRSNSDSGHDESDDYVDWGKRQVDVARKQADVMAWTRSSWTGQKVYHVSLDHSIGYSDDVTDGEPEAELDSAPRQWNRFLPSTMNQRVVNFSWRTVVEP